MKRETRATVGLIAPRSRPRIGAVRGCTAHWNGPAMGLAGKSHAACRQAWRNVQRFHMGRYYTPNPLASGRHWADVAYTFAVCRHDIAMDGRGKDVRTAANGTNDGNDHWYACFFMIGGNEEPTAGMLQTAEWYARVHLGITRWNRHTDHKSTTCAGTVNKYISGGKINLGGASPAPAPTPKEPDMSQYGPENWDDEDKKVFAALLNNTIVKNTDPARNFAWFQRRIEALGTATLQNVNALARVVEEHAKASSIDQQSLAKAVAAELDESLEEIGRSAGKAAAEVTAADIVRVHGEALIAGIGEN